MEARTKARLRVAAVAAVFTRVVVTIGIGVRHDGPQGAPIEHLLGHPVQTHGELLSEESGPWFW